MSRRCTGWRTRSRSSPAAPGGSAGRCLLYTSDAADDVAGAYDDRAAAIAFDAGDPASIAALVDATMQRFGRIDILHNNAAFVNLGDLGHDATALDTPLDVP